MTSSGRAASPRAPVERGTAAALNAGAIVVAALYFGRELFVPVVLAVLLAFVLAPVVALLQRARLGRTMPVVVAVLLAFAVIGSIGDVVYRQGQSLVQDIPTYQATIEHKISSIRLGRALSGQVQASLDGMLGVAATGAANVTAGLAKKAVSAVQPTKSGHAPAQIAVQAPPQSDASALVIVRTVVPSLLGPIGTTGVVLIFVIFVLLFREDLRDRLVRLVGREDLHRTILAMNDAARRLSRYFLFQVAINTGFGAFIAAGLAIAGLPNPILWGILAAMMRFVPFIGTFIAVAPPLLLALAVVPGWTLALIVLGLFVLSELVMGQVVEPLLYGHSTGLSPIAVIMSATFWAFLWGPVGLILATPLTVCLVVIGRHVKSLEFLEVMLGDRPPLDAEETFYQRALEGNDRLMGEQARQCVARTTLLDYYDQVALRGLALAQNDLSRDALAFDRLEAMHQHIETLVAELGKTNAATPTTPIAFPAAWQEPGAVLCIPGRGPLDDLTARMAEQALTNVGFGARVESHQILAARDPGQVAEASPRLVCLTVLEGGSSTSSIRYLLRRIARQLPDAAVVVCLWHAPGDSPKLADLRSQAGDEMMVFSLGELVALVRAVCARREKLAASLKQAALA
jgi:predicted PurR-regulated permease PerM